MRAARFVHQAGQQRALLAVKEIAAKPLSVKPSTDQFDEFALSPATGPAATPPPSETPLTDPCPSTTLSPTKQLDAPGSSVAADLKCVFPPVSPHANQTTGRPSRITEVQINPILLALSTALTLNLELTEEVNNEGVPPPSQFLDNPIAGIPTENIPNGDASEANRPTPSTPISGRRTARINSILAACYDELDKTLMKAVSETSCSVQQVLDSWNKSCGQVITATNHWNLWPSYVPGET